MRKIIIHIGIAKTGTSAIQKFMHVNRSLFLERGILYPLSGQFNDHSHHELAFSLSPDGFRDDSDRDSSKIIEELKGEIIESKCDVTVLSSECFPCLLDYEGFRREFSNYDIKVVCFLRDPVSYLESWYRQWVKDTEVRYSDGFDVFFNKYAKCISVKQKIDSWLKYVSPSDVVVKDFDRVKKNGDICLEFAKLLGVSEIDGFEKVSEVNQSLSVLGTRVMEITNAFDLGERRPELLGLAISIKDREGNKGGRLISSEQAEKVMGLYAQENISLLTEYSNWND